MARFGRGERGPRTAADREAARLERERRRAEREGRPLPDSPAADEGHAPTDRADPPPFEWEAPPQRGADADPPEWEAPPQRGADADPPEWEAPPQRGADADPREWEAPPQRGADADPPEWEAPRQDSHDVTPVDGGTANGRVEADVEPGHRRESDPEPAAPAASPEPAADGHATPPRARAWQRPAPERNGPEGPVVARERAVPAPAEDPQATQPFEPIAAPAGGRRTVSLPRPQTETGEHTDGWDAPIGTVRMSRGRGGHYQAQPGASGYPPYRKLGVNRPRRRWLRRIVALLALALAIGAAVFAFLLFQPMHGSGGGRVAVTVPAGATAGQIGDLLAQRGVVKSSFFFSLRARLSGQRAKLRSGRYTLKRDMPYGAALTALTTAPKAAPVLNVTLPEGPSRREAAPRVVQAGVRGDYLSATRSSSRLRPSAYGAPRGTRTLEGFLFPATYELRQSQATAQRLVAKQLDAFKAAFAEVDMRAARRKNLSRYDVLIIASMIEREALVPSDRRLISAVIYNRLKQNMPLGIDATLRYALNQWSRPLRVSELDSRSSFNTRRRRGLPPTPIGNPGLSALRAAANPAAVSYLFYVVKPCGKGAHAFSSTDAQFQRDVARYNQARARRGGKDPSRC